MAISIAGRLKLRHRRFREAFSLRPIDWIAKMPRQSVTLKAQMPNGIFYWVTEVDADTEEEAVAAAEELFLSEIGGCDDWHFSEFEVTCT
jgi:hypothetical protein